MIEVSPFLSLAFVPGVNISRCDFVEPQVRNGYSYIHTRYQHLFVYLRSFNLRTQVYTTARPAVVYGTASTGPGIGSEIWLDWLRAVAALPTSKSKRIGISSIFRQFGLFGFGRAIVSDIKGEISNEAVWSIWKEVFLEAPTLKAKVIILLNLPFVLVPLLCDNSETTPDWQAICETKIRGNKVVTQIATRNNT